MAVVVPSISIDIYRRTPLTSTDSTSSTTYPTPTFSPVFPTSTLRPSYDGEPSGFNPISSVPIIEINNPNPSDSPTSMLQSHMPRHDHPPPIAKDNEAEDNEATQQPIASKLPRARLDHLRVSKYTNSTMIGHGICVLVVIILGTTGTQRLCKPLGKKRQGVDEKRSFVRGGPRVLSSSTVDYRTIDNLIAAEQSTSQTDIFELLDRPGKSGTLPHLPVLSALVAPAKTYRHGRNESCVPVTFADGLDELRCKEASMPVPSATVRPDVMLNRSRGSDVSTKLETFRIFAEIRRVHNVTQNTTGLYQDFESTVVISTMLPGGNLWQVLPDELYKNSRMLTQFDDKRRDEVKSLKDSKDTGALPIALSCGGLSLAKIAPIENVNESNGQFGISDQTRRVTTHAAIDSDEMIMDTTVMPTASNTQQPSKCLPNDTAGAARSTRDSTAASQPGILSRKIRGRKFRSVENREAWDKKQQEKALEMQLLTADMNKTLLNFQNGLASLKAMQRAIEITLTETELALAARPHVINQAKIQAGSSIPSLTGQLAPEVCTVPDVPLYGEEPSPGANYPLRSYTADFPAESSPSKFATRLDRRACITPEVLPHANFQCSAKQEEDTTPNANVEPFGRYPPVFNSAERKPESTVPDPATLLCLPSVYSPHIIPQETMQIDPASVTPVPIHPVILGDCIPYFDPSEIQAESPSPHRVVRRWSGISPSPDVPPNVSVQRSLERNEMALGSAHPSFSGDNLPALRHVESPIESAVSNLSPPLPPWSRDSQSRTNVQRLSKRDKQAPPGSHIAQDSSPIFCPAEIRAESSIPTLARLLAPKRSYSPEILSQEDVLSLMKQRPDSLSDDDSSTVIVPLHTSGHDVFGEKLMCADVISQNNRR